VIIIPPGHWCKLHGHTANIVTWPLPTVVWRHPRHGKQSSLYCWVLDCVYRVVAWHRIDQLHYNI
jgi:hypothetical protein